MGGVRAYADDHIEQRGGAQARAAAPRKQQGIWLEPAAVARAVAAAVDESADPRKLHYCVDWLTWCAVKLTQLDALLGLGTSRIVQKALWIGHDHVD